MKKTTVLLVVLAVALIGFIPQANAAVGEGNYLALKGGIYSPSSSYDLDNFNAGNRERLDSKTGFAGEVAFGHYLLPILAVEFGAGYFESKGSPLASPGETKLTVVPLLATGKVSLPLGSVEPYGLFGIGAYITDLDVNNNSGDLDGSTEITYGLHAGAGVNIKIQRNMFVGLEGKYLWAEPSFGGQHIPLDGFVTTAVIGFRL
ncbi:MAG: outer membrane beta-barrel protein [Desulfuromonadales bacterium]|nr:outer membrane beta-barrel protein [Desulfuromonadales bacterium]